MIPTLIEKDIKSGKARYKTFQTGVGGQSVLTVPSNSYIIIYGYDFIPAGGGFIGTTVPGSNDSPIDEPLGAFMLQQVSFLGSNSFHPFMHHQNLQSRFLSSGTNRAAIECLNQHTDVYIISSTDVAITVGLVLKLETELAQAIPVTNKTPFALTYGGDAQTPNIATAFSKGVANPPIFLQPSQKEFDSYTTSSFVDNANDQVFAVPDAVNGLIEPSSYINTNLVTAAEINKNASMHYYLNVQYALYTNDIPEQLG